MLKVDSHREAAALLSLTPEIPHGSDGNPNPGLPAGSLGMAFRMPSTTENNDNAEVDISHLKHELVLTREECRDLQKKTERLEADLTSMRLKHEEAIQQCLKAQEEARLWHTREESARAELHRREAELAKSSKQAAQYRSALKAGKGEVEQLVQEVRKMGEQVLSMHVESEASKEWGRQLEKELETVKERERQLLSTLVETEQKSSKAGIDGGTAGARSSLMSAVSTMERRVEDAERAAASARREKEAAVKGLEERVKTAVSLAETESDLKVAYLESEVQSLNQALKQMEGKLEESNADAGHGHGSGGGGDVIDAAAKKKVVSTAGANGLTVRRERVLSPTAGMKERGGERGGEQAEARYFRGRQLPRSESFAGKGFGQRVHDGSSGGGSGGGWGPSRWRRGEGLRRAESFRMQRSGSSVDLHKLRGEVCSLRSQSSDLGDARSTATTAAKNTPRSTGTAAGEGAYDLDLPFVNTPRGAGESGRVERV